MSEVYDPPGLSLPYYFVYRKFPGKMVSSPNGGAAIWRISADTGGWSPRNDIADEILHGTTTDVSEISRAEFVQRTEWTRGRYLRGDGPVHALYETIRAVEESAEAEKRKLTDTERALVEGLRRKTFVMFEEELRRRGDPAADPSLAQP